MFDYHTPADSTSRIRLSLPWKVSTVSYPSKTTGTDGCLHLICPGLYRRKRPPRAHTCCTASAATTRNGFTGLLRKLSATLAAAGRSPEMIVVIPNVRAAADDRVPKEVITPKTLPP